MESTPSKDSLEKHLIAQEDWYRALIFDSNKKPIASKNVSKLDDAELTYIFSLSKFKFIN